MQYRKKPVVIDAFMYGIEPRPDWFNDKVTSNDIITYVGTDMRDSSEYYCEIKTLEGVMRGNCRDYIIKGVQGEIYPCKPDIFEMTYELASTLPQQEICISCDEQKKTHEICMDCIGKLIKENQQELSDDEIEQLKQTKKD
jgi:ribosomal protein L32